MKLTRRAALNGTQLDGLDPSIVIRGTDPGTTKKSTQYTARMGGSGQRPTGSHWDTLDIAVTYAIDLPKKQLAARRTVFDKVNKWALSKGWLTLTEMDGKRVYVSDVTLPSSGDLFNWTDEFTLTFKAAGVPFWQDATATTASIALADSGSGSITVPGIVETVCDAEITNAGDSTIDTLSVTIGNSSFSFTSLGLAAGEKLSIGHWAETGDLYIRKFTGSVYTSVMGKRTGASADDLYVQPGANTITITGGSVTATVSCYGRYV